MAGVGVDLTWLQLIGICPYVMVSPEGTCRISWILATWCVLRLLLLVVSQVCSHLGGPPNDNGGRSTGSIPGKLGFLLLSSGTHLALTGLSVLLLLQGRRLIRLLRAMAAMREMMAILKPSACWSHGFLTFSFVWTNVGFYVWSIFKFSGYFVHAWMDGGRWRAQLFYIVNWILNYPVFLVTMLLASTVLVQLQAATRAALPPGWEQLVAEVAEEATERRASASTVAYSLPGYSVASLAAFLRRSQVMLLQTEEVVACLLQYLGGALLLLLTCGIAFFTFSAYFFLLRLQSEGVFDCYSLALTTVFVTAMLEVTMAVETLVQEVRHRPKATPAQ